MTLLKISHYRLHWNTGEREGHVTLIIPNGPTNAEVHVENLSAAEFFTITDILRNEKPCFWESESKTILTGAELVGEGELG